MTNKIKRAGLLFDCHHPFSSETAYNLALDVLDDIEIDELILGGDFLDFYSVNSHGKDGDIKLILKDEIEYGKEKLSQLQKKFRKSKRVFLCGNHEHRLCRYLNNIAPELYGVYDIQSILKLEEFGFEYVEYGPTQSYNVLGTQLIARHEGVAGGMHCAHATVMKAHKSVIFGHHHRHAESQVVSFTGEYLRGISVGCLADISSKAMSYVPSKHQWQNGFAVVYSTGGNWFSQNVQIIDGRCMVDGVLYAP